MLRVVLGVTGGISAYKATGIIRSLTEAGHQVKVIPTSNALRFIGAATLEALSHNSVDPDLYSDVAEVKHVQLGQEADLVIVAPATANFLARYAAGIADDLLGTTLLATKAPVVVAPAMHTEMWQHPSTVRNVATLRERGVVVLEPDIGRLTGADSGPGRLPEPEAIVAAALATVEAQSRNLKNLQRLSGKRILISAGGTHEPIDAVRYIGNSSSGKQGIALAQVAASAGAIVTLVGANLPVKPSGVGEYLHVATAQEMADIISQRLPSCDALIMAAAVSDYRVEDSSPLKLKKSNLGDRTTLTLVANPDILATSVERIGKSGLSCLTVGFAAETPASPEQLEDLAAHKLASKGCDILVANDVSGGGVFGSDRTSVVILSSSGETARFSGSKVEASSAILNSLASLMS